MNTLRLHGATVDGVALANIHETSGFSSYISSNRINGDGTHAEIIASASRGGSVYSDIFDGLFGIESASQFFASGGRLIVAPCQSK